MPLPRIREELLREIRGAAHGVERVAKDWLRGVLVREHERRDADRALHRGEHVVEVVRDAAGEDAEALELLHVEELRLERGVLLLGAPSLREIQDEADAFGAVRAERRAAQEHRHARAVFANELRLERRHAPLCRELRRRGPIRRGGHQRVPSNRACRDIVARPSDEAQELVVRFDERAAVSPKADADDVPFDEAAQARLFLGHGFARAHELRHVERMDDDAVDGAPRAVKRQEAHVEVTVHPADEPRDEHLFGDPRFTGRVHLVEDRAKAIRRRVLRGAEWLSDGIVDADHRAKCVVDEGVDVVRAAENGHVGGDFRERIEEALGRIRSSRLCHVRGTLL